MTEMEGMVRANFTENPRSKSPDVNEGLTEERGDRLKV